MQRIRSTMLLAALALLGACRDSSAPPTAAVPALARGTGTEGYPTRGEQRSGYVPGRDGSPVRVDFEVQDGRAIWQGDIDLGPAASIARTADELRQKGSARQGVIIDALARRWVGGIVPYAFEAGFPNQFRVNDAIAHIEAATNIVDFVPRTTQTDYILVVQSSGCSSSIGRQGGVQTLNIGLGCSTGNTTHEFLHALGMHHEQSRCDRDSFVEILWANVQPGTEHNFTAQCDFYTDVFAYDEGSIMHYGPTAFSSNGLATIRSLRGLAGQMGQRTGLSGTDVSTVNRLYPPFSVSISGKQNVARHESPPYTATVSGGDGPFTYEWRTRQTGPSVWGSWSPWYNMGSSNVTYASINSCGLNTNYLEVRVTDGTTRQTTAGYSMYVTNPC